jgi:transposase
MFACATPAQRLDDWIECMVRALSFYGGSPQLSAAADNWGYREERQM